MNGEPTTAAQTKRIAERDNVDPVAIVAANHLACRDGDSRCRKAHGQMFKMHRARWRLRRWPEAGEALLSCLDHATGADANEIRREETRGLLRGLCVEPLVFKVKDGLGHCRSFRLRLSLRDRIEERDRK